MPPLGVPETFMVLVLTVIYAIPAWRIARKMGYPAPIGLLVLVPFINVILVYVAAFAEWPVHRELRSLRGPR